MVGVDVKFVDVKSMYYMIYTNDETALGELRQDIENLTGHDAKGTMPLALS